MRTSKQIQVLSIVHESNSKLASVNVIQYLVRTCQYLYLHSTQSMFQDSNSSLGFESSHSVCIFRVPSRLMSKGEYGRFAFFNNSITNMSVSAINHMPPSNEASLTMTRLSVSDYPEVGVIASEKHRSMFRAKDWSPEPEQDYFTHYCYLKKCYGEGENKHCLSVHLRTCVVKKRWVS